MIERARAFWLVNPGQGELRSEPLAPPGAAEVLVRTLYSAVSRGTESLVFHGRVPASEYQRMRCPHQVGEFPGPVKYGYSSVGVVQAGNAELLGRPVFCLFPHQSAYVVPTHAVLELPAGVPPERAVLAANMETAINAIWDAAPRLGDRVTVVGAGVVGCLCAYLLARHPGVAVELVDLRAERAELARELGAHFARPEQAQRDRDLIIHASGSEAGLCSSLQVAGPEATVLELSWFGDRPVSLPLGAAFHVQRLSLRSSQVGTVSPRARARFDHRARLRLALELCQDPLLDRLIDGESPFESLPETMLQLTLPSNGSLCHRLRYDP
ncbi:MAG TPA: zinc-binding alcohol dehydrogenase [Polyangiaceae bacterium]|jgi:2-desacetyl-2-hydroxyethyl bacteriochlorophyllide A dehydrogenase